MIKAQKEAFLYFNVIGNWPILDKLCRRNAVLNYFKVNKPSKFLLFARSTVRERLELAEQDPEANKKEGGKYPDLLASFIAAQEQYPHEMSNTRITIVSMG